MTQVANAFKMPYHEKEPDNFVSFDPHHQASEVHHKREIMEKLLRCDDRETASNFVLGYD